MFFVLTDRQAVWSHCNSLFFIIKLFAPFKINCWHVETHHSFWAYKYKFHLRMYFRFRNTNHWTKYFFFFCSGCKRIKECFRLQLKVAALLARIHSQILLFVCFYFSLLLSCGTTNNLMNTAQMFSPFCGIFIFQVASESRCSHVSL